ncbi:hypothetical protein ACOMHN_002180 [Nucella lapillus]
MSTTLSVLHVLMSGDRSHSLLMTSSTPTSLMTPSSLLASLDPALVDFWSGFPCPPPWNEALLYKVNWTSCVSQTVGERIRWFLAHRCHIPFNGTLPRPDGGGQGGGGGDFGDYGDDEVCDMACKILVALFCFLFVVGVIVGGVCLLHRRRSQKRKDPRRGPQQTNGSGTDRGRAQYAGIHYASASVITREGERPLPPCPEGEEGGGGASPHHTLPRQLHSYVYNPRNNDHDHSPDPGIKRGHDPQTLHLHLCPLSRRAAAYRAMEPYENGDDPPHHYDYISDTDSVRYPGGSVNDYTYCTCEHSEGGSNSVAAECNSAATTPRQSEGYHSDHDLAAKHEISKPYPRYPHKSVGSGRKPFVGCEAGLNNNNHQNPHEASGVFFHGDAVLDNERRGEGYLPSSGHVQPEVSVEGRLPSGYPSGRRSVPAERAPTLPRNQLRHFPAAPAPPPGAFFTDPSTAHHSFPRRQGHPGIPGEDPHPHPHHHRQYPAEYPAGGSSSSSRPGVPLQGMDNYEDPVDGIRNGFPTDRTHIPLQSMNSYELPVNTSVEHDGVNPRVGGGGCNGGRVGGGDGGPPMDTRKTGGTLRFVNAPTEDWDSSVAGGGSTAPASHHGDLPTVPASHHGDLHTVPAIHHDDQDIEGVRGTNVLAVHPRYFGDRPDANTSSV